MIWKHFKGCSLEYYVYKFFLFANMLLKPCQHWVNWYIKLHFPSTVSIKFIESWVASGAGRGIRCWNHEQLITSKSCALVFSLPSLGCVVRVPVLVLYPLACSCDRSSCKLAFAFCLCLDELPRRFLDQVSWKKRTTYTQVTLAHWASEVIMYL